MFEHPANDAPCRLIRDCSFGEDVVVAAFTNLYECRIGSGTRIGPFTEIQAGVEIGSRCKIQSHSFICTGVEIGEGVFIGHGVVCVNDKRPRATGVDGTLQGPDDWDLLPIGISDGVTIGSGALILGGVTLGREAIVGAGAIVAADVPAGATVRGEPARLR